MAVGDLEDFALHYVRCVNEMHMIGEIFSFCLGGDAARILNFFSVGLRCGCWYRSL